MDLKIKDVANLLGVSESTIRRWLAQGKIPAYLINHRYRFNRNEIENWMMGCRLNPEGREEHLWQQTPLREKQLATPDSRQYALFRAIHRGGVHRHVRGDSKVEIIRNTVSDLAKRFSLDAEILTSLFLDRERLMPTALNQGVAIPHTRDFLLHRPYDVIAVIFPETPLAYGALDRQPVHTLFFLISGSNKAHLHLLAKIAHLSSNAASLALLRERPPQDELLAFIKNWESSIPV